MTITANTGMSNELRNSLLPQFGAAGLAAEIWGRIALCSALSPPNVVRLSSTKRGTFQIDC